jgi:hypothetical protein
MNKFSNQLKQGHKYERESLKYLEHDSFKHDTKYRKEYDLIIIKDGKKIKIEVKSDRQASITGNLAIEYECNKKGSGITTTEADFWVYFIVYPDRDEVYKIPIDDLKELIKSCNKVSGGDGGRSRMYLLYKTKIKQYLIEKNEPLVRINNNPMEYFYKPIEI